MDRNEATGLVVRLNRLYPKWEPTDEEVLSWSRIFRREDKAAAEAAVDELWENKRFNAPSPGKFREILTGHVEKTRSGAERKDPETDVYIQCMRAPGHTPARAGWFLPVFLGPLSRPPRRDRLLAAAERMRADHEAYYGGDWIVFQGCTFGNMVETRSRVRVDMGPGTPARPPGGPQSDDLPKLDPLHEGAGKCF